MSTPKGKASKKARKRPRPPVVSTSEAEARTAERAALRAELVALAGQVATLQERDIEDAPAAVLLLWACSYAYEHGPAVALLSQIRQELNVLEAILSSRSRPRSAIEFVDQHELAAVVGGIARRMRVAEAFAIRLAAEDPPTPPDKGEGTDEGD